MGHDADPTDVVTVELPRYLWGAVFAACKEAARKHAIRADNLNRNGDDRLCQIESHRARNAELVVDALRPVVKN